jgi:hypothetical protein
MLQAQGKGDKHMQWIQRSLGVLLVAGTLSLGLVGPAASQVQVQDGLVNVAIGDVEILNNANIGVVAEVVAQICGVRVSNIAVLAQQVDRSGRTRTVCETDLGAVTMSQNQ